MTVKLLTAHHLEFLSLKGPAQARLSLHLSKCHIAGNHMSRLNLFSVLMRPAETVFHVRHTYHKQPQILSNLWHYQNNILRTWL